MLKIRPFAASLFFATAASAALAQPVPPAAAPLGLELGVSKCTRLTHAQNHVNAGKAAWAGGDAIEIKHLERFNLPGLTRVIVNCDASDAVALITLTFDRTALEDVTKKLDARYESKRKTDPGAENGYAEWAAANGSIEVLYGRDGKQFTTAYWAKGAKAKYFAYGGAQPTGPAPAPAAPTAKVPAPL